MEIEFDHLNDVLGLVERLERIEAAAKALIESIEAGRYPYAPPDTVYTEKLVRRVRSEAGGSMIMTQRKSVRSGLTWPS